MLPFGRNWKSELLSTCNAVRIPLPSQEVGPEYIRSGRCILLHVIKHNLAAKQNLKARCVRTGLGDPAVAGPILYYWRASEASETLSGVYKFELVRYIYMYGGTYAIIVAHATHM